MTFKGWRKTSLIEYPGKISTVLFTGGCNFRCPFCYNVQLVLHPEELPDIPEEEVLRYLQENRPLYQALVVTGGEPTLDEELPRFLGTIKEAGFAVGLETNGTNPGMLRELAGGGTVDYVAMDVKTKLDPAAYAEAAGLAGPALYEKVLKSIELLESGSTVDYELRLTVVPGLHSEEDVLAVAEQLHGAKRLMLQQFVPGETLVAEVGRRRPHPPDLLQELKEKVQRHVSCSIRWS